MYQVLLFKFRRHLCKGSVGIWKRSFMISTIRPPSVYINSSRKRSSSKMRNLKPVPAFIFMWTGNTLTETELLRFDWLIDWLFENDDVTIITWFLCPNFPQTQIQNEWWLFFFETPTAQLVDGKHIMRTSVFKSIWPNVHGDYQALYVWPQGRKSVLFSRDPQCFPKRSFVRLIRELRC